MSAPRKSCLLLLALACSGLAIGSDGMVPPEAITKVAPPYPREAVKRGIEGRVVVRISIDTEGAVAAVAVRQSPHEILSDAVEAAVKQWKYRPATKDGRPTPSTVRLEVDYNLKDADPGFREHGTRPPDAATVSRYVASQDGVEAFRNNYWREGSHKAFASGADGSWGWVARKSSAEQAVEAALHDCDSTRKPMTRPCKVVDVDGQWQKSAERTATPLMQLSPFEIARHPRETVESWDAEKKARATPLLDQCRAEADRWVEVWKAADVDAIYAAVAENLRQLQSREDFGRAVAAMRKIFGSLKQATFSGQKLVTRWGDDELRFDLHSEVVYSAATTIAPEGTSLVVLLSPEAGACRVTGFYYAANQLPAPWLPGQGGQGPQRGT
jgi:TonB family protein